MSPVRSAGLLTRFWVQILRRCYWPKKQYTHYPDDNDTSCNPWGSAYRDDYGDHTADRQDGPWQRLYFTRLGETAIGSVGNQPTSPQQLQAALTGGTITTGTGATATTTQLQGVLTMRSQGMGWGQIAQKQGLS